MPITQMIECEDATPEVREVYDDIMATRNVDWVNNFWKVLAVQPELLRRTWNGVKDVMTPDPEALPSHAKVAWVLNIMSVGGLRHVPVVDEQGRPVAVVSVRDVVQFLVDAFPSEVLNLPPEFASITYRTREGA